ncbi:hypothetical protein BASA50_006206 [Batrachochytrium salamandrivorans]|uniref:4Fe-4S ferredoxin-type domain-containing protein n=1 Tax=Batrachochytrium salamandrivorans TaxID=1357716 RepID=A0ABQ8FDS4_9FUNG|nr:hypothetical protein BASA50_006206 [Batrachochytrium salamandrivorans]
MVVVDTLTTDSGLYQSLHCFCRLTLPQEALLLHSSLSKDSTDHQQHALKGSADRPRRVLYGTITPCIDNKNNKNNNYSMMMMGFMFGNSLFQLQCVLLSTHPALLGCCICVWDWNIISCTAGSTTINSMSGDVHDGSTTATTGSTTATTGSTTATTGTTTATTGSTTATTSYILEIISASPWLSYAHVLDTLPEFDFVIPYSDLSRIIITARHAGSTITTGSTIETTATTTATTTNTTGIIETIQGIVVAKTAVRTTKKLAHWLVRIQLSHDTTLCPHILKLVAQTATDTDSSDLMATLLLKGPPLSTIAIVSMLCIESTFQFTHLKPQKLTFPSGSSALVLVYDLVASAIIPIAQSDPSTSLLDICSHPPHSYSSAPQSIVSSTDSAVAVDSSISLCTPNNDTPPFTLLDQHQPPDLFHGITLDLAASWNHTVITYTGYITAIIDYGLLAFQLDTLYSLVCTFSTPDPSYFTLRPGTHVRLVNVHLVYSSSFKPVYLVMCAASSLQTLSFGPAPEPSSLPIVHPSLDLLAMVQGMSFTDLMYFQYIHTLVSRIFSMDVDRLFTVESFTASISILGVFEFTPVLVPSAQMFLCHDQSCSILSRKSHYPHILSVADAKSRIAASLTEPGCTPLSTSITSIKISASDFNASAISCIGRLDVDARNGRLILKGGHSELIYIHTTPSRLKATTVDILSIIGHLVVLLDVCLISEVVFTGEAQTSIENSPLAPLTIYSYIEVSLDSVREIGRFEPSLPEALASQNRSDKTTHTVCLRPQCKRSASLHCNLTGDVELEAILQCGYFIVGLKQDPMALTQVYFRFLSPSLHIPDLLSVHQQYLLELTKDELHTLCVTGAMEWNSFWKITLDDSGSFDIPRIVESSSTIPDSPHEPLVGAANTWSESLASLSCHIVGKQWRVDRNMDASLSGSRDCSSDKAISLVGEMGRSHTRSQELSREFVVGLGREDLTLVLQVEVFHSTRRLNIHWDIRKVAFPFGVLVGRRVRLDHLSIKQLRHGGQFVSILPITCISMIDDCGERDPTVAVDPETDASEDTQIGTNTPLFRICSLLSSPPPRLQQVCLLAVITTIAQVSFTAICQSCKRPCSRNVCPSNCTHPEFGISAQAVVFVDDGTAEASITLSGIESVTTLLQLSALDHDDLEHHLNEDGLVQFAIPSFHRNATDPSEDNRIAAALAPGKLWLENRINRPSHHRRVRIWVKVGASHGSFSRLPPTPSVLPPSTTCIADLQLMRPRSASAGAGLDPIMTLSYKPIRLYSLCLSEISARDLALDLLSSLCRKS